MLRTGFVKIAAAAISLYSFGVAEAQNAPAPPSLDAEEKLYCLSDGITQHHRADLALQTITPGKVLSAETEEDIRRSGSDCAKQYGWDEHQMWLQREYAAAAAGFDIYVQILKERGFKKIELLQTAADTMTASDRQTLIEGPRVPDPILFQRLVALMHKAEVPDDVDAQSAAFGLMASYLRKKDISSDWRNYRK